MSLLRRSATGRSLFQPLIRVSWLGTSYYYLYFYIHVPVLLRFPYL